MCLGPEVLAGLALSGAGTYLQAREQNANAKRGMAAKSRAFTENMARNTQFANEASVEANKNVKTQSAENFGQQQQIEKDKMQQLFNERRTQPDYNVGLTTDAPKNVVLARETASQEAGAKTDRDVSANAALQGYGNTLFNSGMGQNEFARLFGNIQDKAGANTRMLPLEMNAAYNNSQKAGSLFPTLLKLGGTGLSLFGGAGGTFTGPVEGALPVSGIGPGAPTKGIGLFMNNQPFKLFGHQLAGRSPF